MPSVEGRAGTGPELGRRVAVLRVLKAATTPLSIGRIAEMLEVHPNTVRFHLNALVESGQAERVEPERTRPGRPAQLFRARRGMDPTGPRDYRILAEVLTAGLAAEPAAGRRAVEAGRAWGRRLAPPTAPTTPDPVDQLVTVLDDLGFAPERRNPSHLGLRNCPFLELAEVRAGIVCPIHLGLMQGALEAWEAPVTVERLDAFVEPDLCLAQFAPTGTASNPATPLGPASSPA
jgi:predicted ArsR family transcriptional regulator